MLRSPEKSDRLKRGSVAFVACVVIVSGTCLGGCRTKGQSGSRGSAVPSPTPIVIPISNGFDYPFGSNAKTIKPEAGWYDAQKFTVNNHLGEDWNRTTGGNTDCGLPVYAASKGVIVFAAEAGPGWGKVLIVRHRLPDNTLVETLYGHLQSFVKTSGEVERREQVGSIGDGGGAYPCHLHFELRLANCPAWGQPGPGYNADHTGWTAPSEFIGRNRSR